MKSKIVAISLCFFFLMGTIFLLGIDETCSQEGKIGYVDSMRLRSEFKEFTDAQAKFDQDVKTWQEEIAKTEALIDSLQDDLDKTGLMLSDTRKKEKEDNLKAKKQEYQRLTNEIFGPGEGQNEEMPS